MQQWPSSLPDWKIPLSYKQDEGMVRTNMSVGPAKTRPRYSAVPTQFQTSFICNGLQRYVLEKWYEDTLGMGALPFERTDPANGGKQSFRFLTSPDFTIRAGAELPTERLWDVTLSLERMPGQSQPEFTALIDGTFANSLINFTRSSPAWYWGSDGLLKEAAANEMRFDYDPATGELLGVLIEEERTNLITRNTEIDHTDWAKVRSSVTANTVTAPDGTKTAGTLFDNTENSTHYIKQSLPVTTGDEFTVSVIAKRKDIDVVIFVFGTNTSGFTSNSFDLEGGMVIDATNDAKIEVLPNGWYRCSIMRTATGTGNVDVGIGTYNTTPSYAGTGTDGVYIWGAQFEIGSNLSSPIITGASSVMRAADEGPVTDLSWFDNSKGTFLIEVSGFYAGIFSGIMSMYGSDFFATRTFALSKEGASNDIIVSMDGFYNPLHIDPSDYNLDGANKFAVAADTVSSILVSNNEIVGTSSFGINDSLTTLNIGDYGGAKLNGHIKRLHYYPTRLPNAKLQELTR